MAPKHLQCSPGVALAGILAIAVGLRVALLGQHSLWFDEAFLVWVTRFRWEDIPRVLRAMDSHPPLYYFLMKAWIGIAGTSEAALRIPSACLSALAVALTYALMRRTSSQTSSLLAAFLVGVSPFAVMAAQEARMYPLLGVLALGSTLALAAGVERGGAGRWAVYSILATLMAYTQYLGVLVLLAHGVWVAAYERRRFLAWLAGMGVAAALYAPWMPFLWSQAVHGNAFLVYRDQVTYRTLGDLLGLFAFGGSLFGMGTYFSGGTLGGVEQLIVLLPFLAIIWQGGAAMKSDGRSLALLGLPLVIPIGGMVVLSLARPLLFLRWFTFLLPFYAMFLARGLVDVAERIRASRERVLAFLAACLLLYSVPVLDRYYGDPGSHPYRWRDAAALVNRSVRPGDYLLYVGREVEIPFRYYFREPTPWLTVTPVEAAAGQDQDPTLADLRIRQLARQHPRVWLIATTAFSAQVQQRLLPALSNEFRVVGVGDFTSVWVYLLEARPPRS